MGTINKNFDDVVCDNANKHFANTTAFPLGS